MSVPIIEKKVMISKVRRGTLKSHNKPIFNHPSNDSGALSINKKRSRVKKKSKEDGDSSKVLNLKVFRSWIKR